MANDVNYKSLEKFAAGVLKLGVFLVFLNLLFVVRNHLAPFHFGKLTAFRIIIAVMAVFYVLLLQLDRKKYSPKISFTGAAFFAYFGVIVLTAFIGADFNNSLWGSIERMGGLYNMIFYIIFLVILSGLFKTREDWDKLLALSAGVSVLMSFYAMGQMYWFGDFFLGDASVVYRPVGTTGNSLFLGTYLLWNLFFAGYLVLRYKKNWHKMFFGAIFVYDLIMFFTAQSRGAFVGLMAGLFVMGIFMAIFGKSKKIKVASLAVVLLVVTIVGMLVILRENPTVKSTKYLNRFSDLSLESSSIKTRLWTWSSAWKGFLDRPIFGYGAENFYIPFSKHYRPEHFSGYGSETWFDRAHNTVLDVLAESGVLGMASYLFFWVAFGWFLIKRLLKDRENAYCYIVLIGAAVAYNVQSLTIFNTYTGYLMLFLFIGFVNFLDFSGFDALRVREEEKSPDQNLTKKQLKKLRKKQQKEEAKQPDIQNGAPNYFILALLSGIIVLSIIKIDIPSTKQNYWAGQATAAIDLAKYDLALQFYKKSLSYNSPIGDVEIAEKLAKFSVEMGGKKNEETKNLAREALAYAIDVEEKMVLRHPEDVKLRLILGRLYNMFWDHSGGKREYLDKALEHLLKGEELSPSREQIHFEIGQTYVLRGEIEKGVAYYRKPLDANPEISVANYYYAMALYNLFRYLDGRNDLERARVVLEDSVFYMNKAIDLGYLNQLNAVGDIARMSSIYASAKESNMLRKIYEKAIIIDPNNIQAHSSLAVVYRDMGMIDEAREQAFEVKRLAKNEKQNEEIEKFLKTLE